MGKTLRIGLAVALVAAATLGITNYLNREPEQGYCEYSSEQGALNPEFIGRTEENVEGKTLEQLLREGKLKDGVAAYFNNGDYAVYVQGKFVYSKFNTKTGRFDENPVSLSEIGENPVVQISRPIPNKDFERN